VAQAVESKIARTAERRIIERPRLLKRLDESDARTILLVAPAGYGKTTLARQWLQRVGGTWLSISSASGDIPVLAKEVSETLAELVPIDSRHIESALRSARTPSDQAKAVVRAILEQVPVHADDWVVIDDCHLLDRHSAAEELLATLELSGRFKLMLTSRSRPSWVTSRRLVYHEVVEFGSVDLALDETEIAKLLSPRRLTAALSEQVRGWPAVIGLVAYSQTSDPPPNADSLSKTLYDYFADELYERATSTVQRWLRAIALLPPVDPGELSMFLKERDSATQVLSTGLARETDGRIEVHPLARAFLLTKVHARADSSELARASISFALSKECWDEAFWLIVDFHLDDLLECLITSSFSSLVETGRIATLEAFGRHAAAHSGVSQHLLDLIEAEIAVRDGAFDRALVLGQSSAAGLPNDHPLKARGFFVAGSAAQFDHRLEEAFDLHGQATRLAVRTNDINDATWGKCLAALYLEDHRLRAAVQELEAVDDPRPEDRLRMFIARQHLARLSDGLYDLRAEGAAASHLLTLVTDPWVRTGWGNVYGYALVLQAQYENARVVLTTTLNEIETFGLAFGRPHIEWSLASAELGLRHFSRADALLRRVEHHADENGDFHLQLNARVLRARSYLAQQRPQEAVLVTSDDFVEFPSRAMYGEYLSTRALALAIVGSTAPALETASRARTLTGAVETQILCTAAQAVAALGGSSAGAAAEGLLVTADTLRTWDGVLCAARASPGLVAHLAAVPRYKSHLRHLFFNSNDAALARTAGLASRSYGPHGVLSRREREVIDLLRLGLTNDEIAAALFIAGSTVKVHVRHIMEKLGARTRTEAVTRYAELAADATVS
jgi:DNA-binding CsgD family transcriptional regulator/tetratricopeptide (TPR) repeat protein